MLAAGELQGLKAWGEPMLRLHPRYRVNGKRGADHSTWPKCDNGKLEIDGYVAATGRPGEYIMSTDRGLYVFRLDREVEVEPQEPRRQAKKMRSKPVPGSGG